MKSWFTFPPHLKGVSALPDKTNKHKNRIFSLACLVNTLLKVIIQSVRFQEQVLPNDRHKPVFYSVPCHMLYRCAADKNLAYIARAPYEQNVVCRSIYLSAGKAAL